ncbi:MAG: glycosyltransferase family 39 protein [Vicinamibacterales bacterium]
MTLREATAVVAASLLLAVVMTWPVAPKMHRGARVDSTDAMYAMWNVAWVARAVTTNPAGLFDANIFHPHKGTLAYSEGNIGAGVLGAPAWLASRNVYTTYNSVVLAGFMLSFICTYALTRRLTGSRTAAAAAAIAFAYAPYVYARLPHIQLQMTFGMPLALLAFHRAVDRPGWRSGVVLGVALAIAALSSAYYGVLIGLAIGAGAVFYGVRFRLWRTRQYWIAMAVAVAVLAAILLPFFLPYLTIREQGFERTLDDARRYGVNWWGWLASPVRTHGWLLNPDFRGVAFPGITRVIGGLAGLGIVLFSARHAAGIRNGRAHAAFYLLVLILTFWTSFGPQAGLYTVLHNTFPVFFAFLRAVERFAILVTLALCVGLAFSVKLMQERWQRSGGRAATQRIGAALLFGLIVADSWVAPLYYPDALPVPRVYHALARAPREAVAEFPFFYRSIDLNRHGQYMLFSTYHWQPLINGYSDHYPKDFIDMLDVVKDFPTDPRSFSLLRDRGARYVVLHLNWYHHERRPEIEQGLAHYVSQGVLRFLDRDRRVDEQGEEVFEVVLYEIRRYPEL